MTWKVWSNLGATTVWGGGMNIKLECMRTEAVVAYFEVLSRKCPSRKSVHKWVEKFSQGLLKVTDDERPCAEVAETTVKGLVYCGFRRTGKAMGQMYQCWWRMYREINVRFLYPFVTGLLIVPRSCWRISDQCLFYSSVCCLCADNILWHGRVECGTLCKGSVLLLIYFCLLLVGDGFNVGFVASFDKM
jgi:hypothetical protein